MFADWPPFAEMAAARAGAGARAAAWNQGRP
jgi:hypothetical protein